MRIFLTGATGYVGAAVLDALIRAGHQVTALVRGLSSGAPVVAKGGQITVGNLAEPASYRDQAVGFDAYVHAAFESSPRGGEVDRIAAETLVDVARTRPGTTLIYTSGVWVLGPQPTPAAEDARLDPPAIATFRVANERLVLDAGGNGPRTVVVRPGIVYGGARGIVSELLRDADNGLMRVIGSGDNRWPVIYDRDLADLYARLVAAHAASGVFHATDESDERVNDIVNAIARHAPSKPAIRRVPIEEARKKLGPYADALVLDQVVRSPRARAIGWAPTLGSVTRSVPRLFEEWRNARAAV